MLHLRSTKGTKYYSGHLVKIMSRYIVKLHICIVGAYNIGKYLRYLNIGTYSVELQTLHSTNCMFKKLKKQALYLSIP
jgi:hypothetical protein